MTLEERILRNDTKNHYTDHDIKTHLKDGVFYYDSYEEFFAENIKMGWDPAEILDMWNKMDVSTVDGVEYHYDVAL